MKKFLYILSILTAILLFDSCTKEDVTRCDEHQDAFGLEFFDDDSQTRGNLDGSDGGGIVDQDNDDDESDEDDDVIVDPDNDDDESDEDDDELIDDRVGDGDEDED
ncbi:MAG: hypothetical protein GQ574_05335 [Crocinitomix sp.]|nr:hypothetical protein [Crocinitomix sp.]